MKVEIKGGEAFSYLQVDLEKDENIVAESDAMSSMSASVQVKPTLNGGFFSALLRKFLLGETFFINRFLNSQQSVQRLTLVQPNPGQVIAANLQGNTLYLQPGAFLACTENVRVGIKFAGFVSWIAREGLFHIAVSGHGTVWYGAYGALIEKELDGEYIIDTSHLVSYSEGVKLKLQLPGGILSSVFGGEGLVTRVEGKGKVVIQTRSLASLTNWINPKLP